MGTRSEGSWEASTSLVSSVRDRAGCGIGGTGTGFRGIFLKSLPRDAVSREGRGCGGKGGSRCGGLGAPAGREGQGGAIVGASCGRDRERVMACSVLSWLTLHRCDRLERSLGFRPSCATRAPPGCSESAEVGAQVPAKSCVRAEWYAVRSVRSR